MSISQLRSVSHFQANSQHQLLLFPSIILACCFLCVYKINNRDHYHIHLAFSFCLFSSNKVRTVWFQEGKTLKPSSVSTPTCQFSIPQQLGSEGTFSSIIRLISLDKSGWIKLERMISNDFDGQVKSCNLLFINGDILINSSSLRTSIQF